MNLWVPFYYVDANTRFLFCEQSVVLYIFGDERAVSNEASNYLTKITSGNISLKLAACLSS